MPVDPSAVAVGDRAPDFTAPGTGGRTYTLSEFRGQPVVLVFYPGDATPVCTEQLLSYSDSFDQFSKLNAQVLALSPQDVDSHEAFSAMHGGFNFPLLYDKDKEIGTAYGVPGPLGFYRRSVFVIDAEGIIRFAKRSTAGLAYASSDSLINAVESVSV